MNKEREKRETSLEESVDRKYNERNRKRIEVMKTGRAQTVVDVRLFFQLDM